MKDGLFAAIGNTPLVRLSRVLGPLPFELFGKLEALNPGGSSKDRSALEMMRTALRTGALKAGSVVIESSSGNMGIGLAQVCSYFGLRFICVVDPKITAENRKLLEAYGAEVDLVRELDPETREFLPARLKRVQKLLEKIPNSFWPNQYRNHANAEAHHSTMAEIAEIFPRGPDFLFCATGTCGTIRGCSEYVREHNLKTRIVAVDAAGSVIFGGEAGQRLIPGHGSAIVPPLFSADLAQAFIQVTDLDCVVGCRRLVLREGLLLGGSSGAVIAAVDRFRNRIPAGGVCAAILPDRGERYLETIYSESWIREHFPAIPEEANPVGEAV